MNVFLTFLYNPTSIFLNTAFYWRATRATIDRMSLQKVLLICFYSNPTIDILHSAHFLLNYSTGYFYLGELSRSIPNEVLNKEGLENIFWNLDLLDNRLSYVNRMSVEILRDLLLHHSFLLSIQIQIEWIPRLPTQLYQLGFRIHQWMDYTVVWTLFEFWCWYSVFFHTKEHITQLIYTARNSTK